MKTIKRIFAVLLAVLMVMGLSVTAFAEGETYTISINNAVDGQTYKAYKIFDATHQGEGENMKVSYSISTGSVWYSVMTDYKQYESADDTDGYNPFVFTPSAADSAVMVVTIAAGKTVEAAALAAYLNNNMAGKTPVQTATAVGTSVTLDVTTSGEGYYFVDTSVGALCSLNTVTGLGIVIEEKNSLPNIQKSVQEDDNGVFGTSAVLDVIDKVHYKLQVNAGRGADENYVIKDTLPAGFVYEANSIAVSCEKTTPNAWVSGDDYSVSYTSDNRELTITLLSAGKLGGLDNLDPIIITYNADMTAGAVQIGAGTSNTNTATLTYKGKSQSVSASVMTYEIGGETDDTGFTKVDGATNAPLAGVEFILSKDVTVGVTTTTYYAKLAGIDVVPDGAAEAVTTGYMLNGWTTTNTEATPIITDTEGKIDVKGLDSGEYILTETGTLPGYNLLSDTITVMVDNDGTVKYRMTKSAENSFATKITIKNNTGTELPSTGGMGTTVFYIVGSILVLGAAVLLIVRKRMSSEQ